MPRKRNLFRRPRNGKAGRMERVLKRPRAMTLNVSKAIEGAVPPLSPPRRRRPLFPDFFAPKLKVFGLGSDSFFPWVEKVSGDTGFSPFLSFLRALLCPMDASLGRLERLSFTAVVFVVFLPFMTYKGNETAPYWECTSALIHQEVAQDKHSITEHKSLIIKESSWRKGLFFLGFRN